MNEKHPHVDPFNEQFILIEWSKTISIDIIEEQTLFSKMEPTLRYSLV